MSDRRTESAEPGQGTAGGGASGSAAAAGFRRGRERFVTGADGVRLCVEEYGAGPRGDGSAPAEEHHGAGPTDTAGSPGVAGSGVAAEAPVTAATAPAAEAGRRPTVVLLHGYPDSKEVWAGVAALLADRYPFHVVLYDVRGHGRSGAPVPLRGGFTLQKLTADFLAVADAVSPDRPVHLVGHDWGSVRGWEFATTTAAAGRLASFTSISGPCLDHYGLWFRRRMGRPTPRSAAQVLGQGAKSWYILALHTPALPELAWRGVLGKQWPKLLARAEKIPAGGYPTASLPRDASNGTWLYRDNIRQRLGSPRPDAYARVPVQLITPTRDAYLSERLYDDLDQWVPRLTRRTLPAKHWVPRTRPEQVSRWVADFVTRTERESPQAGGAPAPVPAGSPPGVPAGMPAQRGAADPAAIPAADLSVGPAGEPAAEPAGTPAARTGAKPPSRSAARPGTRSAPGRVSPGSRQRFGGQLVLVTGAASGIGRATVLAFAEAGAQVVAVDRDARGAAAVAELAREAGAPEAWAETVDVSDAPAMEDLARRTADRHGVPDVVVNNAGIGLAGPFLDTTPEDWKELLDVNLWGVIHGCRLFGRQMVDRGQGGHIVNTASAAAFLPSRALPAYSTSKAAVLMLSESLRLELAPHGIGVSAICPGVVNTPIAAGARHTGVDEEEQRRRQARAAKLYRLRNYPPEKVARAVLRAVQRDLAVVAVTPEARGARVLSRLSPGALRALARINPLM